MRWLPLVPLLVMLGIGQVVVDAGWVNAYFFPSPLSVAKALVVDAGELWRAALATLLCSLAGFLLSAALGMLLGIVFSSHRLVEAAFFPYAIFFQTVPIIAIAPLLVIWVGYGPPTVVASAFIVSVFPIIAGTLTGLKSVSPALMDLFTLNRASPWQRLWKLKFPSALPHVFVGLRVAAGLSVIGAIVGEFIAGGGLGGAIDVGRARQRVDVIFAAIGIASLIGLGLVWLLGLATRKWAYAHPPG